MSLILWRISNYFTLDGVGGLKYPARWHSVGRPIVYLAESPSGALLETLVHLDTDAEDVPDKFTLLRVESSVPFSIEDISVPNGTGWRQNESVTRPLGDRWLTSAETALAKVPSALVPQTYNYLLNPLHPKAAELRITGTFEDRYDLRLIGYRRR